jgi:nicotinamide mononucleotide transporter
MIGPLLLGILSWKRQLYADVILQIFYILITVYGWLNLGENWSVTFIPLKAHLILIIIFLFIGFLFGQLLKKSTNAALPLLDSIVTSISMLATALMMAGCHENWIYFMFINSTCIYLFFKRKLYGISMLYLLYLLLAIEGYFDLGWIPL